MKLANENKTLKQLLTEPYRVQKKEGYYSYEAFRQTLLKQFRTYDKEANADIVDTLCITTQNSIKQRMHDLADQGNIEKANGLCGVLSILSFLLSQNKKLFYLDQYVFSLLTKTDLPPFVDVKFLLSHAFLLLFPYQNEANLIAAFVYETNDDIVVIPVANTDRYASVNFMTLEKRGVVINKTAATQEDKLSINFLLWQQSMHDKGEEVIELDAPTKTMGFGKNSKQIIVPRVIGEGYKPKVIRNYDPQGTHASPRTHWRRGHWRQQPVGARKDPKHKTIWVEPVLVNG